MSVEVDVDTFASSIDRISLILVVIGAIKWGAIGLFQFDIVAWLFGGQGAILSRIIYIFFEEKRYI